MCIEHIHAKWSKHEFKQLIRYKNLPVSLPLRLHSIQIRTLFSTNRTFCRSHSLFMQASNCKSRTNSLLSTMQTLIAINHNAGFSSISKRKIRVFVKNSKHFEELSCYCCLIHRSVIHRFIESIFFPEYFSVDFQYFIFYWQCTLTSMKILMPINDNLNLC